MKTEVGDWIVGPMVVVFGLIGLFLCGRANDAGMTVFGASLALFAAVFVYGLYRRRHDDHEAARAAAKGDAHG